jgi:hypothetical protein
VIGVRPSQDSGSRGYGPGVYSLLVEALGK